MSNPIECGRCGAELSMQVDVHPGLFAELRTQLMTAVEDALRSQLDTLRTDITRTLGDLKAALGQARVGNLTTNQQAALDQATQLVDVAHAEVKATDPQPAPAAEPTPEPAAAPEPTTEPTTDGAPATTEPATADAEQPTA